MVVQTQTAKTITVLKPKNGVLKSSGDLGHQVLGAGPDFWQDFAAGMLRK